MLKQLTIAVALGAALTTPGFAQSHEETKLIAHAEDLDPPSIQVQATEPIVKVVEAPPERVLRSEAIPQGSQVGAVLPGNNCVSCVRALTGRGQSGNAGTWRATHSVPKIGSILILRPGEQGAGPLGHVAYVVGVSGSTLTVQHCNWGEENKITFQDNGRYG